MILDCRPVVGFGRLGLVAEMAQVFSLAAAGDVRPPQPSFLIERDAWLTLAGRHLGRSARQPFDVWRACLVGLLPFDSLRPGGPPYPES